MHHSPSPPFSQLFLTYNPPIRFSSLSLTRFLIVSLFVLFLTSVRSARLCMTLRLHLPPPRRSALTFTVRAPRVSECAARRAALRGPVASAGAEHKGDKQNSEGFSVLFILVDILQSTDTTNFFIVLIVCTYSYLLLFSTTYVRLHVHYL